MAHDHAIFAFDVREAHWKLWHYVIERGLQKKNRALIPSPIYDPLSSAKFDKFI